MQDISFLSCLYGSERPGDRFISRIGFSKLPARQ